MRSIRRNYIPSSENSNLPNVRPVQRFSPYVRTNLELVVEVNGLFVSPADINHKCNEPGAEWSLELYVPNI